MAENSRCWNLQRLGISSPEGPTSSPLSPLEAPRTPDLNCPCTAPALASRQQLLERQRSIPCLPGVHHQNPIPRTARPKANQTTHHPPAKRDPRSHSNDIQRSTESPPQKPKWPAATSATRRARRTRRSWPAPYESPRLPTPTPARARSDSLTSAHRKRATP